ncbi:MAG: hypothetical protein EXQ86_07510 [Rhodospirillales bacterium]|nr:hypothetical protein [Rhodospirillales bacterium]
MTTNPTIQKQNRLECAHDRLIRAVSRLEAAARPAPAADPAERAQSEGENRRLNELQTQVERRLDATILRLKSLLDD